MPLPFPSRPRPCLTAAATAARALALAALQPALAFAAEPGASVPAPGLAGPAEASAQVAQVAQVAASPAGAGQDANVLPEVKVQATRAGPRASQGTNSYTTRSASSATRLDLALRETPQSVSVLTRTLIEDFNLHSVQDLLGNATGITVERVETDRTYYTARGFDISNFQIDGIGLPFATGDQMGDIDTAPFDRVEVLRGANGLVSSTGNPSATINFIRKRPTSKLQASASATVGSWNMLRVEGDVSGALNEAGTLRGRVIAAGQKNNSYLDRYSRDKQVFSGILEADLGDHTTVAIGHLHQDSRPEGNMWGALPMFYADGTRVRYDASDNMSPSWTYWNARDLQTFGEITHAFGDGWQGKVTLTKRELATDGELFYLYLDPVYQPIAPHFAAYPSKYWQSEHQWILDANAKGPFQLLGRKHEAVVGATVARSKTTMRSVYRDVGNPVRDVSDWEGDFPRPDFENPDSDGQGDFKDRRKSLYAAVRWSLADRWSLLTGLNRTQFESEGESYDVPHNYDASKTTPYVGTVFDLDAQHSLYASFAKIFNPQTKQDSLNRVLPPVEGSNTEIGLKGEWLDKKLNGSFALFRVKQDNVAESDGAVVSAEKRYRSINAISEGFEVDIAGRITPGWEVVGGYTQLRFKDDEGLSDRTHVPRKTLRLSSTYRLPMLPPLKVGAQLRWQSDTSKEVAVGGQTAVARQDAYALLDLTAQYDLTPNVSARLNVYNVTDRKYLTSLYWDQSYYGAPRHADVTLSWKY